MPSTKFEEFDKDWSEKKLTGRVDKSSFLIGEPKKWSQILESENKKEWVWENYIAKGHITLLSALWKAGKSTLLRHLFLAINNEEEFAGQPTTKSNILIISEEAEGEWLEQKESLESNQIDHVKIWSRPIRVKPNLKQWVELIEEVAERCVKDKIDLVVIDTLTTFWPIDNENDSAQVIKALVPLYSFSENNIAVLLVHHFRKGGGDQAQASRGSGALPGFVDNIIEFTRNDNGYLTQRILKTYGRFDGVIPSVVIDLTAEGKYVTLGDPWAVSKSARLQRIIDIFSVIKPDESLSSQDVYNLWSRANSDITLRSIQRYFKELIDKDILTFIKEEIVVRKKTSFYALKGQFREQATITDTLSLNPVASFVPVASLSSVTQKQAQTEETTGTSVISDKEIIDVFGEGTKITHV